MTSILTSISGQFGKPLILGIFFPTVLFVMLGTLFLLPLFPGDWTFFRSLQVLATEWQLAAVTLLAILLSGILYNLNNLIIRFYEGYPWQDLWLLGTWRMGHYQRQFEAARAQNIGMRTLLNELERQNVDEKILQKIERLYDRIGGAVNNEFPSRRNLVLPTRLGNIMRSFEDYADRQYGMDAVTLWPRLIAKVAPDYATSVDDTKISFNFMINSSILSFLLALAMLVIGAFYGTAFTSPGLIVWLVEIAGFMALTVVFYHWSINRAKAYGATVKGAFDLYRWELLKQLGYKQVPKTVSDEKTLWDQISRNMIYGYPRKELRNKYPIADYDTPTVPQPHVRTDPAIAGLKVTRGVSQPGAGNQDIATIVVHVANTDSVETAEKVIVSDKLPDGSNYVWGLGAGE